MKWETPSAKLDVGMCCSGSVAYQDLRACYNRATASLVWLGSQREVPSGHGLEVPHLGSSGSKSLVPLELKASRGFPSHLVVTESHADKVSALIGLCAVDKARASVEHSQIVDEVHVTCLGAELKLGCLCNFLDRIQSLNLVGGEGGQIGRSGVGCASHESGPTEVGDQSAIFVEEDRSALVLGAVELNTALAFVP